MEITINFEPEEFYNFFGEDQDAQLNLLAEQIMKTRGTYPSQDNEGDDKYPTQAQRDEIIDEFIPQPKDLLEEIAILLLEHTYRNMNNEVRK